MVHLINGLNKIRDIHKDNINNAWVGTDGTAPVETQTGLQAGEVDSVLAVTITQADQTNVIEYVLNSATATGETYREFAYLDTSGTTTVEYNRRVFTGIEHTERDDIIVRQVVFYRNP